MEIAERTGMRLSLASLSLLGVWLLASTSLVRAEEPALDLTHAIVVATPSTHKPEQKAVQMLIEEVEKRSRVRWERRHAWPDRASAVVVVGSDQEVRALTHGHIASLPEKRGQGGAEGYQIGSTMTGAVPI